MRLLNEKTMKDVHVQDICNECGISKTTFYAYFRDKYDAANTYYFQSIESGGMLNDASTSYEERRLRLVNYYRENAEIILHLLHEEGQDSLMDFIFRHLYEPTVEGILEQYSIERTQESEYLFKGILSGQISCIRFWLEDGCPCSSETMRDVLLAVEEAAALRCCKKVQ